MAKTLVNSAIPETALHRDIVPCSAREGLILVGYLLQ